MDIDVSAITAASEAPTIQEMKMDTDLAIAATDAVPTTLATGETKSKEVVEDLSATVANDGDTDQGGKMEIDVEPAAPISSLTASAIGEDKSQEAVDLPTTTAAVGGNTGQKMVIRIDVESAATTTAALTVSAAQANNGTKKEAENTQPEGMTQIKKDVQLPLSGAESTANFLKQAGNNPTPADRALSEEVLSNTAISRAESTTSRRPSAPSALASGSALSKNSHMSAMTAASTDKTALKWENWLVENNDSDQWLSTDEADANTGDTIMAEAGPLTDTTASAPPFLAPPSVLSEQLQSCDIPIASIEEAEFDADIDSLFNGSIGSIELSTTDGRQTADAAPSADDSTLTGINPSANIAAPKADGTSLTGNNSSANTAVPGQVAIDLTLSPSPPPPRMTMEQRLSAINPRIAAMYSNARVRAANRGTPVSVTSSDDSMGSIYVPPPTSSPSTGGSPLVPRKRPAKKAAEASSPAKASPPRTRSTPWTAGQILAFGNYIQQSVDYQEFADQHSKTKKEVLDVFGALFFLPIFRYMGRGDEARQKMREFRQLVNEFRTIPKDPKDEDGKGKGRKRGGGGGKGGAGTGAGVKKSAGTGKGKGK